MESFLTTHLKRERGRNVWISSSLLLTDTALQFETMTKKCKASFPFPSTGEKQGSFTFLKIVKAVSTKGQPDSRFGLTPAFTHWHQTKMKQPYPYKESSPWLGPKKLRVGIGSVNQSVPNLDQTEDKCPSVQVLTLILREEMIAKFLMKRNFLLPLTLGKMPNFLFWKPRISNEEEVVLWCHSGNIVHRWL